MSSKGIALVTGAVQGIGRAIALQLAEDGFDVAVNGLSNADQRLDALAEEIRHKGRASSIHMADVSQDEEVKNMIEMVVQTHGGLDVMVANAGTGLNRPLGSSFIEFTVDDWDRLMDVNGRGTFLCYKYAGIQMIKQGRGGRIIGATSILGKQILRPQVSIYGASKFAIRALTQAAALEFGQYGITVNAYAPGAIDTKMLGGTDPATAEVVHKFFRDLSPLKTIGVPEDVAHVVSFLASKESNFITAQGIGRAIALQLTQDGFDVAVNDLPTSSGPLEALVDEIRKKGRTSSSHFADVSQDEEVKNMIEMVVQTHGGLDVMVANAGIGLNRPLGTSFVEFTVEDWDKLMDVNARGTFLCYKYAGIQMIKQGRGGRIIGASSVLGKQIIRPQVSLYGASKFAVRALTQAAALEFGQYGITVNAYAPGAIDTPMRVYHSSQAPVLPI
ncbi:NAD(P)-binding protein [Roridomyces roridus]|uniref:NAD(P)-binding protein n=1 Tax=Roridomyces roridus TaxID=1738132 RepID=A0AAD7BI61_9AGAR|nr:NAD(P)-binding protein [Roridomyces roridus]